MLRSARNISGFAALMLVLAAGDTPVGDATYADTTISESTTCQDLIDDIVQTSGDEEPKSDFAPLTAISSPKRTGKDLRTAFQAGKVKPKKGEEDVAVLSCTGKATFSDGGTSEISWELRYDSKGVPGVSYGYFRFMDPPAPELELTRGQDVLRIAAAQTRRDPSTTQQQAAHTKKGPEAPKSSWPGKTLSG